MTRFYPRKERNAGHVIFMIIIILLIIAIIVFGLLFSSNYLIISFAVLEFSGAYYLLVGEKKTREIRKLIIEDNKPVVYQRNSSGVYENPNPKDFSKSQLKPSYLELDRILSKYYCRVKKKFKPVKKEEVAPSQKVYSNPIVGDQSKADEYIYVKQEVCNDFMNLLLTLKFVDTLTDSRILGSRQTDNQTLDKDHDYIKESAVSYGAYVFLFVGFLFQLVYSFKLLLCGG